MTNAPLATPAELWRELQSAGGLELRRKRGPGRDADVESALRSLLSVPTEARSLERWLAKDSKAKPPAVTVEGFLVAILESQKGYANMMTGILKTLEVAGASQSDHALRVAFRFRDVDEPLRLTLEQFREFAQRTERILTSRYVPLNHNEVWMLHSNVVSIVAAQYSKHASTPDFPPVKPLTNTGHPPLDHLLSAILQVIDEYRNWCRTFSLDRSKAADIASKVGDAERTRVLPATDFWDTSLELGVHRIAETVRKGNLDAHEVAEQLEARCRDLLRTQNEWVERTFKEALDILNMPAWKRRHELYSVWAGTRLLTGAVKYADQTRFHVVDGTLSFAFGGSRLATYDLEGEQYDIWAELRSPLAGKSSKRKKEIQPDFRVVRVALATPLSSATRLVLECKHYLVANVSNFVAAASDYARSCENASVFLVNHGPANEAALSAAIDPTVRPRIQFLGDVAPEKDGLHHGLDRLIRQMLFPRPHATVHKAARLVESQRECSERLNGHVASVVLRWTDRLQDVDLSIEATDPSTGHQQIIYFGEKGSLAAPPFARLQDDVRKGPGAERIDIREWHYPRYKIQAKNYTEIGEMNEQSLTCDLDIEGHTVSVPCPPLSTSDTWEVGVIEVTAGVPHFFATPFPAGEV